MKTITIFYSLFLILGFNQSNFGQDVSIISTTYSKVEKGFIGKENYSFSMSNGTITVTDLDSYRRDVYEPLKYGENGFDENGWYFQTYVSDVTKDAARWLRERKKARAYGFYYDSKNGNLLQIVEAKSDASNNFIRKTFLTDKGYSLMNTEKNTSTGNNISSSYFDLKNILLYSTSLHDITTKIQAAFTTDKIKVYSSDVSTYSYSYNNSSNIRALVCYTTSNDKISQIFFLLPKEEAVEVGKNSFISNFQKRTIDGNAVWVNQNGLKYEAGFDGGVGIIAVK